MNTFKLLLDYCIKKIHIILKKKTQLQQFGFHKVSIFFRISIHCKSNIFCIFTIYRNQVILTGAVLVQSRELLGLLFVL